jgi:subtilisin family serine protease
MNRVFVALFTIAISASAVAAETTNRYIVVPRRVPRSPELRMLRDAESFSAHAVRTYRNATAFAATLTPEEAAELRSSGEVVSVTPVVERHLVDDIGAPPAPPSASINYTLRQTVPYGIDMIHARDVWPATRGAGTVNVAIVDTGITVDHPDLAANYAGGYNTYNLTGDPIDDNRHGTHVAGTIGAIENEIGVVGVAPKVRIWSVKVLDEKGFGTDEHIAAGVDWVINHAKAVGGNWIMSLSLGAPDPSPVESELFQKAIDQGILVVAAAGNRGFPVVDFPAQYPGVMAIGAIDADSKRARFSSYGVRLNVVGPGVSVLSTLPVGSAQVADVEADDGTIFAGTSLRGSPRASIWGKIVDCKLGKPGDFPAEVQGNIALIKRGEITFNEKVRAAKAAGAAAVVIYNNPGGLENQSAWSLILVDCDGNSPCHEREEDTNFDWPLTLGLNSDLGQKLLARASKGTVVASFRLDDYGYLSGTSMATPHVTGTAALLWTLAPTATASQIRLALENSAADLGAPGFDAQFGFGLVDALAAAKMLAPEKFGLPPLPAPAPPPPPVRRP